ncbi:hypothetical protein Taro_048872 [Colocasia esculenta]|uniref:Uncharacterized protein n=1 Tax=Colocasia esculenta TaxID=4460 RepID=A0A843X9D2_COLES|nr:hypothetical protein [Colocasia esculenta]
MTDRTAVLARSSWGFDANRVGDWFSCWRLKKSTSRNVDIDLFREERQSMLPSTVCLETCDAVVYFLHSLPGVESVSAFARIVFGCVVTLTCGVLNQDAECDSVLCVLLVVVSSRSPWSPFSTARVRRRGKTGRGPDARESVCSVNTCDVERARFQFSQCAPEGVAYYATGSCVLYRLCSCAAFVAVEPCLSGAGLAWLLRVDSGYWSGTGNADLGSLQLVSEPGDVVFGRWLCRHLSRRLEMPCHHSRLGLNHRTYAVVFVFPLGSEEFRLDHVFLVSIAHVSVAPVGLYVSPWLGWIVLFLVPSVFLPDGGLFCAWVPFCGRTGMCGFPTSWCVWGPERFVLSALDLVEPVAESPVVRLVTVKSIGLLVLGHVLLTFCVAPCALVSLLDHEDGLWGDVQVAGVGFVLAARVLPLVGATRGLFSLILSSLFPSSFTYVLLQHFQLLTGARGKVVKRVAVVDRAGNDRSNGGSCEKLLGVRRESRGELDGEICAVRFFSAVEPTRFQFPQCAPEGVAYYATGSCVLYRLCLCAAFVAVEPCLSGAGLAWLLRVVLFFVPTVLLRLALTLSCSCDNCFKL